MTDPGYLLGLYLHLAQASRRRGRPLVADRLLVLAAATAATMGLEPLAAYCRALVLADNPHHLIRHWPIVRNALACDDFQSLLAQLQRRYPVERAERLLESLDIELGRERAAYYSDFEYAAALLGTTVQQIEQQFTT